MKTNFLNKDIVKQEVKNLIKGAYYRLGYETNPTPLKRAKSENAEIKKQTIVIARFGIEYANMAVNKDRETGGLPNGATYENEYYPYIVNQKNGNQQLVAYVNKVVETKYFLNGEEIDKQWLQDNGYISNAVRKPNDTHRIQPDINHIFELGKVEA